VVKRRTLGKFAGSLCLQFNSGSRFQLRLCLSQNSGCPHGEMGFLKLKESQTKRLYGKQSDLNHLCNGTAEVVQRKPTWCTTYYTRQQNFTFFFWHTRENIKS